MKGLLINCFFIFLDEKAAYFVYNIYVKLRISDIFNLVDSFSFDIEEE